MKKPIPNFKSEEAERDFWATHDSTDFIDWQKAERATPPNLKPSPHTPPSPFRRGTKGEV